MRRTERLFAIAEYLRGRRTGVTAAQIAERFNVTVRTIHRDLDALRDANLPVRGERGRGGGLALDRAYTLPPVNFNAREAAVLVATAQWMADMRLMPFSGTLLSASDKVRAALDLSAQRVLLTELGRMRFIGVPQAPVPAAVRRAVEQAWFEQRPLQVTYRDRHGVESKRNVRIEEVLMDRSDTRLRVTDLAIGETRELRLGGIVSAKAT
jgi:predicted DNA-binding transcriptional regulator YafY